MSLSSITEAVGASAAVSNLRSWVRSAVDDASGGDASSATSSEAAPALQVKGAAGSLPAFLVEFVRRSPAPPVLCLTADEDAAAYLHSDLEQLAGPTDDADTSHLLRFPATQKKPYDDEQITDSGPLIERADVLQQLAQGFDGIILTSVRDRKSVV